MRITKLETWRTRRGQELFDEARQGRAPMNWDLVVLRLHTDQGITGEATAIGVRSSVITQQYLHELIAQGNIHVPKRPGLGIDLDWDAIDNQCLEHRETTV